MNIRTILHDLNNALTSVAGNAECLLATHPSGEAPPELEALTTATANAVRLARDLRECVRAIEAQASCDARAPLSHSVDGHASE